MAITNTVVEFSRCSGKQNSEVAFLSLYFLPFNSSRSMYLRGGSFPLCLKYIIMVKIDSQNTTNIYFNRQCHQKRLIPNFAKIKNLSNSPANTSCVLTVNFNPKYILSIIFTAKVQPLNYLNF
jgi:hypothetical protein